MVQDKLVALDVVEFNTELGNPDASLKAIKDIFGDEVEDIDDDDFILD